MAENEFYTQLVDRNIGLLTWDEQKRLMESCVAVFGLGGLGGVIAQILTRSGIGKLKIVDNDRFEPTNLNRQIFSYKSTLNQLKVDATERFLKEINPDIVIERFVVVNEASINSMLEGAAVAILAIDKTKPCILISRACREKGIPLVEGWAIPFGNVRVYTKDTVTLEEVYRLPTKLKSVEEINRMEEEEFRKLDANVLMTLAEIEGIDAFYRPEVVEEIFKKGRLTSFAPMVWLTAVLMALEATKVILEWGDLALAPNLALYDPYQHRIPKVRGGE
jgi:molybdopterin/thiamine biosynthesis adenylyltransferase